jgi:hypothetical protein
VGDARRRKHAELQSDLAPLTGWLFERERSIRDGDG